MKHGPEPGRQPVPHIQHPCSIVFPAQTQISARAIAYEEVASGKTEREREREREWVEVDRMCTGDMCEKDARCCCPSLLPPTHSSSSCGRGSPHNLHFHTCVYPTVARQRVYLSVPYFRSSSFRTPQLYYYFHKLYKNNNRIALRTDRAKPGEQSDS